MLLCYNLCNMEFLKLVSKINKNLIIKEKN